MLILKISFYHNRKNAITENKTAVQSAGKDKIRNRQCDPQNVGGESFLACYLSTIMHLLPMSVQKQRVICTKQPPPRKQIKSSII